MKRHPESVQADLRQAIDRIQLAFGKGPSIAELMEVARNGQIDPLIRQQAIRTLAPMKPENLFAFLKSLAGDKSVLTEVNRAFIHCTEEDVATVVINRFGNADQEGKSAAISTLCARPAWAARLLKAAENRRIPVAMITAWHARRIHQFQNNALTAKLKSVWGEVQPTNASRRERIEELKRLLNDDAIAKASLDNGRVLFEKQCATCHVLNGRGSRIGPDLTGSDRRNLNYLLENLVHPSAMVAESYQMRIFLLQDGRTISGLVLEENEKALRIQTPDAVVSIARDDLEEQRRTKLSLMPDGLMDSLTPQQQIDLIGFLKRN